MSRLTAFQTEPDRKRLGFDLNAFTPLFRLRSEKTRLNEKGACKTFILLLELTADSTSRRGIVL